MAELTLFGIPNCDTVKKARRWLDSCGRSYRFHNFKKDGVPRDHLLHWIDTLGLERVVNRRGTTWRKLSDEQKAAVEQGNALAIELLVEHPSMIKRPVLEAADETLIGFDQDNWSKTLKL
ncbi:MAG: ArsC family reductase [Granulosicoccaceae bacterium]